VSRNNPDWLAREHLVQPFLHKRFGDEIRKNLFRFIVKLIGVKGSFMSSMIRMRMICNHRSFPFSEAYLKTMQ